MEYERITEAYKCNHCKEVRETVELIEKHLTHAHQYLDESKRIKAESKKDLEDKIATLEEKLTKLANQLENPTN